MELRGSNAAGLYQWDEVGSRILLSGGDLQFFGVQTLLEKVFLRRVGGEEKQLFCCFCF